MKAKRFFWGLLIMLSLGLIFISCGCNNSVETEKIETKESQNGLETKAINNDPIYNFYNKVHLDKTKADTEKLLGVKAEKDADEIYNYIDSSTGYGVFISYDENDQVEMKGIFMPEGPKKLIALSGARVREEELESIQKDMTYDEVVSILGAGAVEIIASRNPTNPDNNYYAIGWINEDESLLLVYFVGFKGVVESAEFLQLN